MHARIFSEDPSSFQLVENVIRFKYEKSYKHNGKKFDTMATVSILSGKRTCMGTFFKECIGNDIYPI